MKEERDALQVYLEKIFGNEKVYRNVHNLLQHLDLIKDVMLMPLDILEKNLSSFLEEVPKDLTLEFWCVPFDTIENYLPFYTMAMKPLLSLLIFERDDGKILISVLDVLTTLTLLMLAEWPRKVKLLFQFYNLNGKGLLEEEEHFLLIKRVAGCMKAIKLIGILDVRDDEAKYLALSARVRYDSHGKGYFIPGLYLNDFLHWTMTNEECSLIFRFAEVLNRLLQVISTLQHRAEKLTSIIQDIYEENIDPLPVCIPIAKKRMKSSAFFVQYRNHHSLSLSLDTILLRNTPQLYANLEFKVPVMEAHQSYYNIDENIVHRHSELHQRRFTPGLSCCQKYYPKTKTILLKDFSVKIGSIHTWQNLLLRNLESDTEYTIQLFTNDVEFEAITVRTAPPRKKSLIDQQKKLLFAPSSLFLEELKIEIPTILPPDHMLLVCGPVLNFNEFYEQMKSSLMTMTTLEQFKRYLLSFSQLFQRYLENHLTPAVTSLFHTLNVYHLNDRSSILHLTDLRSLLLYPGHPILASTRQREYYRSRLGEEYFAALDWTLSQLYYSYLQPFLGPKIEIQIDSFNFYLLTPFSVGIAQASSVSSTFTVPEINDILNKKRKNHGILSAVEKSLVIIARSPVDLIPVLTSELRNLLQLLFIEQNSNLGFHLDAREKEKTEEQKLAQLDGLENSSADAEEKSRPVLFGKYELIHGEYSSSTHQANSATSAEPQHLPPPDLFPRKAATDPALFDSSFFQLIRSILLYNLAVRDQAVLPVSAVHFVLTGWTGGEDFDVVYLGELGEISIPFRIVPQSDQEQNLNSDRVKDFNLTVLNTIEASLPQNVKLRMMSNKDRHREVPSDGHFHLMELQRIGQFEIKYTLKKTDCFIPPEMEVDIFRSPPEPSLSIVEGPTVILSEVNEIIVEAVLSGKGEIYASLYELPQGLSQESFANIMLHYRDKFAPRQIGATQLRQSYGKKMKVYFQFLNLLPNGMYGVVLDTKESLAFTTRSEEFPAMEEGSDQVSEISIAASPVVIVTKTLPTLYATPISTSLLTGLSHNDYAHNTFRMLKLDYLYQRALQLPSNNLVALVNHQGMIDTEDWNSELRRVSYKPQMLRNPLSLLTKRFTVSIQSPTLQKLLPRSLPFFGPSKQSKLKFESAVPSQTLTPSEDVVRVTSKLSGVQIRYDHLFCYIIPSYPTDECLEEITAFVCHTLFEQSEIKVLVVYNMKMLVDAMVHLYNSDEWVKERHLLPTKKLLRQFFETLLAWKRRSQGEVVLISVGLVPSITSILIGYYSEGGVFYHEHEQQTEIGAKSGDDLDENSRGGGIPFSFSIANASKLVQTSVLDRKHCIYLHIFPMYQYNPLAMTAEPEDSDEEEDDDEEEEEFVQQAAASPTKETAPISTYSKEQFLRLPKEEVKITSSILYKVMSPNEMKFSQELLSQIPPLIRIYHQAKTIQFREPVLFHLSFVYNYRGISHLSERSKAKAALSNTGTLSHVKDTSQTTAITTNPSPVLDSLLDNHRSIHERSTSMEGEESTVSATARNDGVDSLFTSASNYLAGNHLKLIVKQVIDEKDYFQITFGPIIGQVTATSIRLLFEFNQELEEIECLLIPTNQREEENTAQTNQLTCKRERIRPYSPEVFVFSNCQPETLYNISLPLLSSRKILGTVKTNPVVTLNTEVVFIGRHHYQNVPIKDYLLHQLVSYQHPNRYDLSLLQSTSSQITLLSPHNPGRIPSIFEILDHNLIKTNQLDQIMVMFHLDSLTFFTHYWEEILSRCFELTKHYLSLRQMQNRQLAIIEEEKQQEKERLEKQMKKKRGYRGFLPDEVLKEIDQKIEQKRRAYDPKVDEMLLDLYIQQIVMIMTDTVRVLWSNPEVINILSKSCHIPLFHSDYILPHSSSSSPSAEANIQDIADAVLKNEEQMITEAVIVEFLRTLFEKQVQAYILDLYGMEVKSKHEMRVWRLGPLLVLLLDAVSGRTKLKNKKKTSIEQESDDEEAEKEDAAEEKNNDENLEAVDGEEDKEELEKDTEAQEEKKDPSQKKRQKESKLKAEAEEGEAAKKAPFSPGFLEKNQWKSIRKLCIDDKITQLIIATEVPLIPLQEVSKDFDESIFDSSGGKVPKGKIIPLQPTLDDLNTFFQYWIEWIAKIRNQSNNIESRSVIFVSKSDIPYSTVIQDLKTGIKLHQVCVGNYDLYTTEDAESNPLATSTDDFVMNGKIGTIRYVHSLKSQDYVRMTTFETENKRNLKRRLKLVDQDINEEEEDREGLGSRKESQRHTYKHREGGRKKSKREKIKKTIIDASRLYHQAVDPSETTNDETNNNNNLQDLVANAEAADRLAGEREQLMRFKQFPKNIQGNVGYAQLKLWLDRWNPIGVWTNLDMTSVHKHADMKAGGGRKSRDRKKGGDDLTSSERRRLIEDGKDTDRNAIDRDGRDMTGKDQVKANKQKKEEDDDDEEEHEDAILLIGPIIGSPIIIEAGSKENDEEEEDLEGGTTNKGTNNPTEETKDETPKLERRKIRVKVPIMIELDRESSLEILLSPLFSPKKQHEFFIEHIPPFQPYVFELGPLLLEERYQVNVLAGLKPSPFNSFVISTHSNWDETNVVVINCELPDLSSNSANDGQSNGIVQPSPFLMVDIFQRCAIPFHGINCIVHNNFQPNFDLFIENHGNAFQLKQKLLAYQQTKKVSPELRMEMTLLFNIFRTAFRDQYSRPSYRELLKAGMNLLVPQYYSLNDYLQMNTPAALRLRKRKKKNKKNRTGFGRLSSFISPPPSPTKATEEVKTLTAAKMNGILLLQLMEQRVIQEYIEQLRYPNVNIYRAVIDRAQENQYREYQLNHNQFVKPNHSLQEEMIEQFQTLYNQNFRAEMTSKPATGSTVVKSNTTTAATTSSKTGGKKKKRPKSAKMPKNPSYEIKDRFELIWSDPLDDPITAVLKQWSIAAIPAPIQWLPYHSVNQKVSIECLSLIHPYQPPALLALSTPAKTEAPEETMTPAVKNNYQISAISKPKYVSNHPQDFDNQRCLNSILALSQAEVKAYVRIVILNNKRFFSTALSSQQHYSYHKRFLETLLRDKTLSNYPNMIITNLNSPEIVALRKSQSQAPIITASPLPQRRSTLIAAEEAKKSISNANDAVANTGNEGEESKETKEEAAEPVELGDLPNLYKTLFNPFQQLLFQFSTLYQLLEDWKRQLFGRDYLLCLPLQFKTLGTSLTDLYYITEEDVDSMLWNWTEYEGNAAAKYAYPNRRSSEQDLASLLLEDIPRLTTHPVQIPLYVIDSIYRSNEYERTSLLSEKRLAMPKKKVNSSQIKSKRAQKKKQEEEMRLMKIILAEIETITQRQIADGYLLLQIQSVKIYTDVLRASKVSKHQSFFANQIDAIAGEGEEERDGIAENTNPGGGVMVSPRDKAKSTIASPRDPLSSVATANNPNNPPEGDSLAIEENDLVRREQEKEEEEVVEEEETVVDVITNVRVHILGDKLTLQKQFELEHPETVSTGLNSSDPSNPLKILNPAFEEAYQLQRFDFLQLPDWFSTLFSQDEGTFIEDEIWFVMKQHTKVSKLQETFELILEALRKKGHAPSSSSLLEKQKKKQRSEGEGEPQAVTSLDFRLFYRQLVHEYETSRLYELSLPEDLREIDFSLAGNLSIFFKDFLMQLWYARPSQNITMTMTMSEDPSAEAINTTSDNNNDKDNNDNDNEEPEQETDRPEILEAAIAEVSTRSQRESGRMGVHNNNSSSSSKKRRRRRSSRRDGFVISAAMRHYMFNLSDDFIRSFCFSKAFHRIIFDHLLRPEEEEEEEEEGEEGRAVARRETRGFSSQEELLEYLETNKVSFENFFHHSPENLQSIFASRQLFMKAVVYALYYAMVMRMARTISLNEKYVYLFQRKDRMTRFIQTIQLIERRLFLQKLEDDKELLAFEAAGRVLEMVESVATNARQRRLNEEKKKEKEKEEAARRAAEAEGSSDEREASDKQFLVFLTPEEEAIFEERFHQLYEEQFNQELAKIEYTPEEYEKLAKEDPRGLSVEQQEEEMFLMQLVPRLGERRRAKGEDSTAAAVEGLLDQERQRQQQEQQDKAKEGSGEGGSGNNLLKMTEEELHDYELSIFQEISEQQVKDLQAHRNKVLLEGLPVLLEQIIDLVLVDGIDRLTSQLIEENMVFPSYELNEENRRLKASVHVRRMTKQRQLQRRKYGKRITFLQFK